MTIVLWGSFNINSQFFTNVMNKIESESRYCVLTFDDGPHPLVTPMVIELLATHNVKATFFCIGKNIEKYPHLVERMVQEGHSIGLHSFSHSYLYDFLPAKSVKKDLVKNSLLIESIAGYKPNIFRPPYGVTNPAIARVVNHQKYTVIGWSIRSLDTLVNNTTRVLKRIMKNLTPGAIILLHDHLEGTPQLLDDLLKELAAANYQVVPLSDYVRIQS